MIEFAGCNWCGQCPMHCWVAERVTACASRALHCESGGIDTEAAAQYSCSLQQVEKVTPLDSDGTCPFVGEALRTLRQEVGNASTVRVQKPGTPDTQGSQRPRAGWSLTQGVT
jgi:hypothetical protein